MGLYVQAKLSKRIDDYVRGYNQGWEDRASVAKVEQKGLHRDWCNDRTCSCWK